MRYWTSLAFPLLANVYVVKGLALKTGIQFYGMVSVRQKYKGASIELVQNSLKTFGVALPVGISYEYKNVTADVRYVWLFTNMCDMNLPDGIHEVWNTNSLWITLGYRINL